MPEPAQKPTVLLLSLEGMSHFNTMYSNLLNLLDTHACIKQSKHASTALDYLATNHPAAILITDAAFVRSESLDILPVLEKLNAYVRNGGTAIFCCHFPSYAPLDSLDSFFSDNFGLPWQRGSYHRTTFALNGAAAKPTGAAARRLSPAYSQKAVHLRHVENAHAVYLPEPESRVESLVFAAEHIADLKQTPVAWAKVEKGWVGYVGDVNAEEESDEVILAMCGF